MNETTQTKIEKIGKSSGRRKTIIGIVITLVVVGVIGGLIYWRYSSARIYIEQAEVSAPLIQLGPATPGILQEVLVHEGDVVPADTVVARVDNALIKTNVAGVIVSVNGDSGKRFNAGEAVVAMIDPHELRVVGSLAEDKGLSSVQVGQTALFTVDAFGSKPYYGIVDEVSPTSRESGIVFNISDQRQSKEFDIKVRFNDEVYSELKNGMSVRLWVLK